MAGRFVHEAKVLADNIPATINSVAMVWTATLRNHLAPRAYSLRLTSGQAQVHSNSYALEDLPESFFHDIADARWPAPFPAPLHQGSLKKATNIYFLYIQLTNRHPGKRNTGKKQPGDSAAPHPCMCSAIRASGTGTTWSRATRKVRATKVEKGDQASMPATLPEITEELEAVTTSWPLPQIILALPLSHY